MEARCANHSAIWDETTRSSEALIYALTKRRNDVRGVRDKLAGQRESADDLS